MCAHSFTIIFTSISMCIFLKPEFMPVPLIPIHPTIQSSFLFHITFDGLHFYFYLYSTQHSEAARMNVILGLL